MANPTGWKPSMEKGAATGADAQETGLMGATRGLAVEEPLVFEQGSPGRMGVSLPPIPAGTDPAAEIPAALLGGIAPGPEGFARYLLRMARGQGDDATLSGAGDVWTVRQTTWQLMRERENLPREAFDAWNELWVGAALAHDRWLRVDVVGRRDLGDPAWAWQISRRGAVSQG